MSGGLEVGACVFDAYGTLFDVGSAAAACKDLLGDQTAAISAAWRERQLDYSWLRAVQGRHADFEQVTADALAVTLEQFGLVESGLKQRLLDLYRRLACFPEVPATLFALKQAGFRLAILSNGTPGLLRELVDHAGLGDLFDSVLSVEAVGVFKPHPRVYQLAVDRLGLPAAALAFVSSNGWDAHGAAAFGMAAVWCNRRHLPDDLLPGRLAAQIDTLDEMPSLLINRVTGVGAR
jgi:2-haloacid dehalogenase